MALQVVRLYLQWTQVGAGPADWWLLLVVSNRAVPHPRLQTPPPLCKSWTQSPVKRTVCLGSH